MFDSGASEPSRASILILRGHELPLAWTDTFRQREIGFDYLSVSAEVTYPLTRLQCAELIYAHFRMRLDFTATCAGGAASTK